MELTNDNKFVEASLKRIASFIKMEMVSCKRKSSDRTLSERQIVPKPYLILGPAGVGKTTSIRALAEELGIGYRTISLVDYAEADLTGVPQVVDGRTSFAPTDVFPRVDRDGEFGILVIDEITCASDAMQATVLPLSNQDNRGIGQYKLPKGWVPIFLGNGKSDGGAFVGLKGALINRCSCWRAVSDVEDWKKYALKHNVHPAVLGFIASRPDLLLKFDPYDEPTQSPSPRAWTRLSDSLLDYEEILTKIDDEDVSLLAQANVGVEAGLSFGAFYAYRNQMLDINKILSGELNADNTPWQQLNNEVGYLTASSLAFVTAKLSNRAKELHQIDRHFTRTPEGKEIQDKMCNVGNWIAGCIEKKSVDMGITILTMMLDNISEYQGVDGSFFGTDTGENGEEIPTKCPALVNVLQAHFNELNITL